MKNIFTPDQVRVINYLRQGKMIMNFGDIDTQSSCTEGMLDGMKNDFTGAKIGGGITGFLIPIGLIGTAIISAVPPQQSSLNFPAGAPLENPDYVDCYMKSVKAQKKLQVWEGAGLGATLALLIMTVVMSTSM